MDNSKFDYTYSAPTEDERREIESIKNQFTDLPKKEDKLEKLRSLNKSVNRPPRIFGAIIGIIGTLVFGVGMTMVLEWNIIVWGVIVGIIGVAIIAVVYPIYKAILKSQKQKYGQLIIDISNELLNEQGN